MPISIPKFFQRAFAQNGGKQDVPITGDTSGGRASYDVGFPPVTRTPIIAGGIPPFGTDFNGVLYDLSQAIQYVQSGVAFPFNQNFATAIGGYEIGAIVSDASNKSLLWINETASNTAFPTGWTQFSFKKATETIRGAIRIGTQAEVNAGTLDDVAVTPKKLRVGWSAGLGTTGFVALPTWLGGFVFQWGRVVFEVTANVNTSKVITFPIAFPSAAYVVLTTPSNSSGSYVTTSSEAETRTGYTLVTGGGVTASAVNGRYFAVGV